MHPVRKEMCDITSYKNSILCPMKVDMSYIVNRLTKNHFEGPVDLLNQLIHSVNISYYPISEINDSI